MSNVFQSLLGAIRGGVHPREVGLAVFLGVLAGFVTGVNLTLAVVLLLALVLRTPPKMFAQAWALAAGLAWALTPVTFRLGHFVLTSTPVGAWLAPRADGPWVALFDLDRYTLIGGACVGLLLALPAAWIIVAVTRAVQTRLAALQEKMAANQRWQARWSTRLACWLLFGETKLVGAAPAEVGWVRTSGVAVAILVLAPLAAWGWLRLPKLLEQGILDGASLANQAEVSAERFELRFSQGTLEIAGLAIADPANLDRDRLRIEQLTAELRPGPLLRGQLHIDKIALSGVATDVPRSQRAQPCKLDLSGFGDKLELPTGAINVPNLPDSCDFGLPDYAKDWKQLDARFNQVKNLLEKIEYLATKYQSLTARGQTATLPDAKTDDASPFTPAYAQLRAMRHSFGPPAPAVWIAELRASNFAAGWGLAADTAVQLTDLSSEPQLTRRPVKLALEADRGDVRLAAAFNVHRPGAAHDIAFEVRDLPIERLVDTSKISHTFAIQGGKLHLCGEGTMTSRQVDLPLKAGMSDLKLRLVGAQQIGGLTPDLWNQGLSQLGKLSLESRLSGRWQSPRLQVNTKKLADQFHAQLRAAGHAVLAQAVDTQLAKAQQVAAKAVNQASRKAGEAIAKEQAKADRAFGAAQQQVARAAEAVQKQGSAAQQAIGALQNRLSGKTEKGTAASGAGSLRSGQNQAATLDQLLEQSAATGQTSRRAAATPNTSTQNASTQSTPPAGITNSSPTQQGADGSRNVPAGAGGQAAPAAAPSSGMGAAGNASANASPAVGPYAEVRPGSAADRNPFAPPGGAGSANPSGGGVATVEDASLPGAPAAGPYPTTGFPSGGSAPGGYPSTPPAATLPSGTATGSFPQRPPGYPNYPSGMPPPRTELDNPFARPPTAGPQGNPGALGPTPPYPVQPQYPTAPQSPVAPRYPTSQLGQPPYSGGPPTYLGASGPYPATPPPAEPYGSGPPANGVTDPRARIGYAASPPGYAPPPGVQNNQISGAQRGPASSFYGDETESPAYEAGGRYELAQPPQGAGIGRRRGAPPATGAADFAGPPVPSGPPGYPSNPPPGGPQNYAPGGGTAPGGASPDQANTPRHPLPVALRGQQAEEETAARSRPLPVALRGRQPAAAGGAPASDEWAVTRWTRETGGSVKNFLFGSSTPPQNTTPQNTTPQRPPPQNGGPNGMPGSGVNGPGANGPGVNGPPGMGQPPNYSAPPVYGAPPQNGDPNAASSAGPRPGVAPNGRGPTAANAPPPAQQAPWYKFW